MPLIPLIASAIIGALSSALVSLIGRAIVALGISAVAYVGFDTLMTRFMTYVNQQLGGIATDVSAFLVATGAIAAIQMVISAVTAVFGIMAAQRFIRMVAK